MIGALWAVVFVLSVAAFVADYLVLPNFDHRYRAAFFPGDLLSAAITQRFEQATGHKPAYIIGSMWDGGNVAHYSDQHPQPRVLIDGQPRRAPWIDLNDLRARGAVIVWTDSDPEELPQNFAAIAPGAEVGNAVRSTRSSRQRHRPCRLGDLAPAGAIIYPAARGVLVSGRAQEQGDRMPKTTDYLRLEAFRATPLVQEPFQHLIVPGFISPDGLAAINADYPKISSSGSFPVDQVSFGPAFQDLLDELESDEFRGAFEEKFGLDLSGRPTVTTVRGRCDLSDGRIHTDSTSKIITVLIYMNESWEQRGGRLRLLRSAKNLNDIIVEVPPVVRHDARVQTQQQFLARPRAVRRRTPGHSIQLAHVAGQPANRHVATPHLGVVQARAGKNLAGPRLSATRRAHREPKLSRDRSRF